MMHTSILNKDTVNLLSFICRTRVLSSQHMMHMAINAVAPLIPLPDPQHNIQNRDILHQVQLSQTTLKYAPHFIPYIFNQAISSRNKVQPKGISFPTSTLKKYQYYFQEGYYNYSL